MPSGTSTRAHRRALALIREHRLLCAVLAAAALLRLLTYVAFQPALFYTDSWAYIDAAYAGDPVGFRVDRPSGYPLLLKLLWLPGASLGVVTVMQHVAGLATGLLSYAFLRRCSVPRAPAAVAAGVVLFEGYALALSQHLMPEAFFVLALMGAIVLVAYQPAGALRLAAAGALLALAITLRSVAVFAVPIVALYALATAGPRRTLVGGLGFLAPLAMYFALQASNGHPVGLNQASGWFLYGRVGQFVDCRAGGVPAQAQQLCAARTARDRSEGPAFHVWDSNSAANRVFGGMGDPEANAILRRVAVATIREHPGEYAGTVAEDLGRYFLPGTARRHASESAISFPDQGKIHLDSSAWVTERRLRYFPGVTGEVHPPAAPLRLYNRVAHMPHLLVAAMILAALLALAVARARRRELLLMLAAALAILVASTATSAFVVRYIVSVYPLLTCAGALGLWLLWLRAGRTAGGAAGGVPPPRG